MHGVDRGGAGYASIVDVRVERVTETPSPERFRDLLAVIDSSVYLLRKHVAQDPQALRHLERIVETVQRGVELVRSWEGEG